jgi:serine/threonine protein kinase
VTQTSQSVLRRRPDDRPNLRPVTGLASSEAAARYHLVAPIGRGGMAEVLLALMDAGGGFSKVVVLKRIWPDLASDPDFVTMFHDEARLAIRLNHPNVVQTHAVIEEGTNLAIAMEYLHGQSLTTVMNRVGSGELGLGLRLRILIDALAGLHYAHELTDYAGNPLGVVHRDVSPHNVFVTYDGLVKLMDFGVAKTAAAAHRTRPGALKGKLVYMAPEHFRSEPVDRRADVFAVGVMLWELLAERRLWHGMAEAHIVHHLAAGVAMPALPPDICRPPVLDAICARALAVNPGERYATAAELEVDLQAVLVGAADSHARTLGRLVSHVFAGARAERDALIARALKEGTPLESRVHWTKELDALLPDGESLDLTVVDVSVDPDPVAPPPPPPARRRSRAPGVAAAMVSIVIALGLVVAEARWGGPAAPVPLPEDAVPAARADDTPPAPAASFTAAATVRDDSEAAGRDDTEAAIHDTSTRRAAEDELASLKERLERRLGVPVPVRHRGHDRQRVRPERGRGEATPSVEPDSERLRPAAVRAIDEGDPFR